MKKECGLGRVLEPKETVPASAWKVDNSRDLRKGEARIAIKLINIEWDSFQQICSSCGYDDEKIKAKILYIIERRGKLHNPFTSTGGVLLGVAEEAYDGQFPGKDVAGGDMVYCTSSMTGIPLYIDEITGIDYNYGQISCAGYAIVFETSRLVKARKDLRNNYTLAALDEAGNLYGAHQMAVDDGARYIAIIGKNTFTTAVFGAALRKAMGPECRIVAIMDKYLRGSLSEAEVNQTLRPLIRETYFLDLTEPIAAYREMKKKETIAGSFDLVIITEDIFGAEALAVMLAKTKGGLYFTSIANHYGSAQLAAENLGKVVNMYAFDQFVENYHKFTLDLIEFTQFKLEEINNLYEKKKKISRLTKSRSKEISINKAGRDDDFIYSSEVTRNLMDEVLNIARFDCNVIIQGETGVGKEKVLSLIHQNSERRNNPCIKINCATIQESLGESDFFGYEEGAFTGARSSGKAGYFQLANNGILFLDEIGTLSLNLQTKLLRVLQENQFYKVGGTVQQDVNIRVICANNIPLKGLVDEGRFREDLYYRLNICTIDVPPLRERRADILVLAEGFVKKWNKKYGVDRVLSPEALNGLYNYYWPGNVRELENVVHRLIIGSTGVVINGNAVDDILNEDAYGDMMMNVKQRVERTSELNFDELMAQQERRIIEYALRKEGTTRGAAKLLGMSHSTFSRKKIKCGL